MSEDKVWSGSELEERMYPDFIKETQAAYAVSGNPALGRMLAKKQGEYTVEDYYALPEDCRVELIDGVIYNMAAPNKLHQTIAGEIYYLLKEHIRKNHGKCMPFISPSDVQLDRDNKTMVQPDVFVYCLKEKGEKDKEMDCEIEEQKKAYLQAFQGAPDMVIEVLSPSSRKRDRVIKYRKYKNAGVREYWIVDPKARRVTVCLFEAGEETRVYSYEDDIPVHVFHGECKVSLTAIEQSEKLLQEMGI